MLAAMPVDNAMKDPFRMILYRMDKCAGVTHDGPALPEQPTIEGSAEITSTTWGASCTVTTPCCNELVELSTVGSSPMPSIVTWNGVKCPRCRGSYTFQMSVSLPS